MVCAKCGHEFCWLCLGPYPSYVHTEVNFCPLRKVMLWTYIFIFLFLSIDIKI